MKKALSYFVVAIFLFVVSIQRSIAQQNIDGYWEGVIARDGAELRFNVEFVGQANGLSATIEIPELYIFGYKLKNIRYKDSNIYFELPLGSEPETFDGEIKNANIYGKYSGRFYQGELRSASFHLWLEKRDTPRYKQEEVTFQNGDIKLAGTLFVPLKKGRYPAVVFFHGSGPQTRESYLRYFAAHFAEKGIATLIYDKRGTGNSTGEIWYKTGDSFDNLVGDALSGVQFLLNRSDINPKKIGLWGLSQGGWLAPLAASRSKDVAFLIAISGGGVTPAEQELYDDEVKLRDKGFSEADISEAIALLKMADDVIRKKVSWETFATTRTAASQKAWFPLLDRFPLKLPKEDSIWQSGSEQLDFDPRPIWGKITVPVLGIFGEKDESTPSLESSQRIEAALKKGGNNNFVIKIFPNAGHGLLVMPKKESFDWERPAAGWVDMMTNWLVKTTK